MMKKYLIPVYSLLFLYSFSVIAWREVGHFSVCEIAYQNLTLDAKAKVDTILGGKNFAEQCTWPDMVRKSKEWKHSYDWHFINVEDDQNYLHPENINHDGDVITAILNAMRELKTAGSLSSKRAALLFLGHFVGDIHQVVHIGKKSDLGGNNFFASWFEEDHFQDLEHLRVENESVCLGPYFIHDPTGECLKVDTHQSSVNLHKIWDLLMVDRFISENNILSKSKYPYKEYVKKINNITRSQVSQWQNSYVLEWAQESLCYRPRIYHFSNRNLGNDYYRKNIRILNNRILMAGYRLAHTLNRVLDSTVNAKNLDILKKEAALIKTYQALKKGHRTDLQLALDKCSILHF